LARGDSARFPLAQVHRELGGACLDANRPDLRANARAALDAAPQSAEIVTITAHLLAGAGEERAAYSLAVSRPARSHIQLNVLAARAAAGDRPAAAARQLAAAPPDHAGGTRQDRNECSGIGPFQQAVQRPNACSVTGPGDHTPPHCWPPAWRLPAIPRYRALYDSTGCEDLASIRPRASSLDDYLRDLGARWTPFTDH